MLMIYSPPQKRTKKDLDRIKRQRKKKKKGTEVENFLFYKDASRHLMMGTHDEEGVYDKVSRVEDFDLMDMCARMSSLEIYVSEVYTLEEKGEDVYQIIYEGKIVCSQPIHKLIEDWGYEKLLTQAVKVYLSSKD
jgi:hypothetical protein